MEIEYSSEEYQTEIPPEKKTKLISKTKLGKTTLVNPNRKYIPQENEIIVENSSLENKKDTIDNNIENEEAIIISNDIPNLRNIKENKATFLIKTIIKAYYLSIWKRKIKSIKYSTRGYNPQRVNFRKFIKTISSIIKQHKFDYFNEICENMDSLPMPENVNHDNNFGTLRIVNKELLFKKYWDKISIWAENNYNKKISGFKKILMETFKKMKENNELYGQANVLNGSRETDYSNYKIYNPSEETTSSKENGKINVQHINNNERDHYLQADYNKENINKNIIYINENLDNENNNYINEKYFNNYNNNVANNNNLVQHNLNEQYYSNDFNNNNIYNNDEVLDTDEQNQENSKRYQYEHNNKNNIDKNNNIYIENNNYEHNNNYLEENNLDQHMNNYINEKINNNILDENIFFIEEDNEEKENDYNNNDYIDSEFIESDYKRTIDKNDDYNREDKENDYNNNDYNEIGYNKKKFNENKYNEINYNNYNYEDNNKFIDNNYIEDIYENNNYGNNNYEINNYDIDYESNNYNNYEDEEEENYNNKYEEYKYKYPQEYNYEYVENDEDNYNNYSNEEYDNDYINDNDNDIPYNEEEDYFYEEPKQLEFENYYLPFNNQNQNGFRYITNERNNAIITDVYTKPRVARNHSQINIYNFANSGINNKFKYFKEEYLVENYGISNLNGFKKYSRAFPSRSDNHSFYISK